MISALVTFTEGKPFVQLTIGSTFGNRRFNGRNEIGPGALSRQFAVLAVAQMTFGTTEGGEPNKALQPTPSRYRGWG
jgi:hypothetical protein